VSSCELSHWTDELCTRDGERMPRIELLHCGSKKALQFSTFGRIVISRQSKTFVDFWFLFLPIRVGKIFKLSAIGGFL
jgi:hypothetical protein